MKFTGRLAVVAATLVIAALAFGTDDNEAGIVVRKDRPRIWLTPERVEALKTRFEKDPFDVREDDAGARALRYVLTGDKADARFAVDHSMKFDVAEDVLGSSVAGDPYRREAMVPVIYDWCNAEMTGEERSAFVRRYGRIAEMMNAKSWGGCRMPGSNCYAGCMRNSGIFGLAAYGETPPVQKALDDALVKRWRESSLPYYRAAARGGAVGEGSQYGRYSIGCVVWLAEAMKTASNRSLYNETNWFREFAYHTIYSTTSAPTYSKGSEEIYYQRFPFGDDELNQGCPTVGEYIGDAMRAVAASYANEAVGAHAAEYVDRVEPPRGLLGWILADDFDRVETQSWKELPLDYFAPGPGLAYLRGSWQTGAEQIMLQLGRPSGGDHYHRDLGSFQICRGGRWLSKESTGYGHELSGTSSSGAAAHNTLLFDGRGEALNYPDGPPRLLAMETHEKYFHAVVDMTDAYRARKSSHLERDDKASAGLCVREFLYIRPDLLIIFDRMKSTAPEVKKTFLLHFPEKPEPKDGAWFLENGGSQIRAQLVYPAEPSFKLVDEGDVEGKKAGEPGWYQWRLEATQDGSLDGCFLTVIAAQERFDMKPACEVTETDDQVQLVVKQPGRRCRIEFDKTPGEIFGHMLVESSGAYGYLETDLDAKVRQITVDADGVHWE